MARCSTRTGLPLDTWAAILGVSPWEFNQCRFPFPKSAQCKDSIFQFPWQRDHLSREEIGEAIASAEKMLADELLYWPYPHYFVDERMLYPRPYRRDLWGRAGTIRGEWKSIELKWKKVISGGVMNRTLINAVPVIVASDEDGDGVDETVTITVTDAAIASITDPYELALYFTSTNRHGEALGETWRLRPFTITISGNVATFIGHRTLLINPQIEFAADAQPLDPADNANYVTALECWRVFTDDTATAALPYQGVAEWKTDPSCTQNCTFQIKELCLGIDNNEQGQVFASFGSPNSWPCCFDREPDRLTVNYIAGLALDQGQIPSEMARVITYLSVSLLANEKCGCDRSNRILDKWRKPILRFEDNNDAGAQAFAFNKTPFPMTVGGQYAWSFVKRNRDLEVVGL